ncbi:MAG TPA: FHA domain-containing protein, partial [Polyangia bacterium]
MAGEFDDFGDETHEWSAGGGRGPEGNIVLLVLAPGGIRSFELPRGGTSAIGRAPTSDVFVDHPSVSRHHAEIAVDPEGVRVRDLGSRNGTRVNGERLGEAPLLLKIGDQLAFGDVNAQLQLVRRLPTARLAQWQTPESFDRSLVTEGERTLRFGMALGFLRIDVAQAPQKPDELRGLITRALRLIDVVTSRAPGRFDLLLPGCDKDAALQLAARMHDLLRTLGSPLRIGVAVYPGDAPSSESLPLAAQLALHGVEDGVGAAREAARVLQLGKHEVVVAEPEMVRLFALIERAAESSMPVLIHGETGTGK